MALAFVLGEARLWHNIRRRLCLQVYPIAAEFTSMDGGIAPVPYPIPHFPPQTSRNQDDISRKDAKQL
jgi:hypothetical protein